MHDSKLQYSNTDLKHLFGFGAGVHTYQSLSHSSKYLFFSILYFYFPSTLLLWSSFYIEGGEGQENKKQESQWQN